MRRKDLWIFLGAVVLVIALLLTSQMLPERSAQQAGGSLIPTAEGPVSETAATPPAEPSPGDFNPPDPAQSAGILPVLQSPGTGEKPPRLIPAEAYLSVQVGQVVYDPIPLLSDNELSIKQKDGKVNVIGMKESAIFMKSATCDNQACVRQGTVTLDNRDSRVLQNMIICLPNEVVLSLLTPKEAQAQWEGVYGGTKGE